MIRFILIVLLLAGCSTTQQPYSEQNDISLRDELQKAERALQEARLMDAEVLYGKIARHHPDLPDVWLKLGNIYARQGRNEAAIRTYSRGLDYQRSDGRIWYNLAVVQLKVAVKTLEDASRVLSNENPQLERIKRLHGSLLDINRSGKAPEDSF